MNFLRPYFLLLLPLWLGVVYLLYKRQGRSNWEKWVDSEFIPLLLEKSRKVAAWGVGLWALGGILAILALSGPSFNRYPSLKFASDIRPLWLVLDLSRSMTAIDVKPNRLWQAKLKLAEALPQAALREVGLIAYAGSAHLVLPLTTDAALVGDWLMALEPGVMPTQGSNLSAALELLEALSKERPADVLVISDGADAGALTLARKLRSLGMRIGALGVGTKEGGAMPEAEGYFTINGQIIQPKADFSSLQALSRAGGGEFSVGALNFRPSISQLGRDEEKQEVITWQDQGKYLLLPLVILAAFTFRRGWLGVFILLSFPVQALEWRDLWLNSEQQGGVELKAGNYAKAAELFKNPLWRGVAQYNDQDFAAAEASFALVDSSPSHYNRGNALAMQGKLEEAVEAYRKALELDPQNRDASFNLQQLKENPATFRPEIRKPAPVNLPEIKEELSEDRDDGEKRGKTAWPGAPNDIAIALPKASQAFQLPQAARDGQEVKAEGKGDAPSSGGKGASGEGKSPGGNSTVIEVNKGEEQNSGNKELTKGQKSLEENISSPEQMSSSQAGESQGEGQSPGGQGGVGEGMGDNSPPDKASAVKAGAEGDESKDNSQSLNSDNQERNFRAKEFGREYSQAEAQWLERIEDNPLPLLKEKFRRELGRGSASFGGDPW